MVEKVNVFQEHIHVGPMEPHIFITNNWLGSDLSWGAFSKIIS